MVAALASRDLGHDVNRKRVQRLMREHALLQRHRPLGRRRRPGFFRVERPDQLWHMDMTSVWVAEHGWCYLKRDHRLLHPRDRGMGLGRPLPRRRVHRGPRRRRRGPPSPAGRADARHRQRHRRGGYRDPGSQAFIESWFSKLKQRCVWREEFETLEQPRAVIGAYIDGYHHRPHSGLAYRTPREVAATWKDHDDHLTPAA